MLKTTLTAAAVAAGLLSPAAALEAGDLDDSLKSGSGINILHKVPGCSILDDARHATQMSDPRRFMFEATKDGERINGRLRKCWWLPGEWIMKVVDKAPADSPTGAFYCVWSPYERMPDGAAYPMNYSEAKRQCFWTFLKDDQIETFAQMTRREFEEIKKEREQKLRRELGLP